MQFRKESIAVLKRGAAIPPEMIEEAKKYIETIGEEEVGFITLGENEKPAQVRKALIEAGISSKKYVKVMKVRGSDKEIRVTRLSKQEFDALKASAEARAAKMRGKKRTAKAKK